ncbi:MAG: leucine-rich repeat protein [Oscillospiraceae bacterium]|nr:leucine-rich repeat protein [Oscillospiraceae bacterium]
MSKNKIKTKKAQIVEDEILDIPEDEIWTYQIEGLAAPKINVSYKNKKGAKILFVVGIVVAIVASLYFSVVALLNTGTLEYKEIDGKPGEYEIVQFSNNGAITEFYVDGIASLNYAAEDAGMLLGEAQAGHNDIVVYDRSKTVTKIHEYAFNCDSTVQKIYIGADVTEIDINAFYSCWALQCIYVDEDNPNYCDLDGVLYNKDMTEIICYPIDHDRYLRLKEGYAHLDENGVQVSDLVDDNGNIMEELWGLTEKYDENFFEEYNLKVRTYVIPSTVEKIGPLCFNYANLRYVYLPEGLKEIGTLGFYDAGNINAIYSYKNDTVNMETKYTEGMFQTVYPSLPEGLEKIGSDCFTKDRGLTYMYIPSSVTYIGHHAFWDAVYKDGSNLGGIAEMNVACDEETFKSGTIGSQWLPKYDYMLFKKNIDVNYSAERAE